MFISHPAPGFYSLILFNAEGHNTMHNKERPVKALQIEFQSRGILIFSWKKERRIMTAADLNPAARVSGRLPFHCV